ncbi:hypothetical protein MNV49_006007 [Pseudohyphozyma bogoriensis]|nr:hypothetical protein MNV49_006007 [Pseudohyphozyma bogoriensis]
MPTATQVHNIKITPMVHDPKETKVDFGAIVTGLDLNQEVDQETFVLMKEAILTHRLLIVKGQAGLHPANQLKFTQLFSPGSVNFSHALDPEYKKRVAGRSATIPDVPQCQVLGYGAIPKDHYGLPDLVLKRADHTTVHKTPLTQEELDEGYTRLIQLHFDGALYNAPPPFIGSLLAVQTPKGPDLTLRFDNIHGRGEKKMMPGSTAYFNAAMAYKLLTPEQQDIANNSTVTYAPHAFSWIAGCKATSDASSIVSEGLEIPLEDLPPWEKERLKTMPFVWHNPLTGEKALMTHGQCAMALHLKSSPDGEVTEVTDLAEVRRILQEFMLPIMKPEYVYCHGHLEGDLALWYNQGMWHSITEFPERCGPRTMHQCNIAHVEDPK